MRTGFVPRVAISAETNNEPKFTASLTACKGSFRVARLAPNFKEYVLEGDCAMMRQSYPCDPVKAAYVKWAVNLKGWSQTQAAVVVGLNVGTVSHVIHGKRFATVSPVPIPGYA